MQAAPSSLSARPGHEESSPRSERLWDATKVLHCGRNEQIKFGSATMSGRRPRHEDGQMNVVAPGFAAVGVFEGPLGRECASLVSRFLAHAVEQRLAAGRAAPGTSCDGGELSGSSSTTSIQSRGGSSSSSSSHRGNDDAGEGMGDPIGAGITPEAMEVLLHLAGRRRRSPSPPPPREPYAGAAGASSVTSPSLSLTPSASPLLARADGAADPTQAPGSAPAASCRSAAMLVVEPVRGLGRGGEDRGIYLTIAHLGASRVILGSRRAGKVIAASSPSAIGGPGGPHSPLSFSASASPAAEEEEEKEEEGERNRSCRAAGSLTTAPASRARRSEQRAGGRASATVTHYIVASGQGAAPGELERAACPSASGASAGATPSHAPETSGGRPEPGTNIEFAVICSDGIFDHAFADNDELVAYISSTWAKLLPGRLGPASIAHPERQSQEAAGAVVRSPLTQVYRADVLSQVASRVCQEAFERGSCGNLSCVIVDLVQSENTGRSTDSSSSTCFSAEEAIAAAAATDLRTLELCRGIHRHSNGPLVPAAAATSLRTDSDGGGVSDLPPTRTSFILPLYVDPAPLPPRVDPAYIEALRHISEDIGHTPLPEVLRRRHEALLEKGASRTPAEEAELREVFGAAAASLPQQRTSFLPRDAAPQSSPLTIESWRRDTPEALGEGTEPAPTEGAGSDGFYVRVLSEWEIAAQKGVELQFEMPEADEDATADPADAAQHGAVAMEAAQGAGSAPARQHPPPLSLGWAAEGRENGSSSCSSTPTRAYTQLNDVD